MMTMMMMVTTLPPAHSFNRGLLLKARPLPPPPLVRSRPISFRTCRLENAIKALIRASHDRRASALLASLLRCVCFFFL